MWSVVIVFSGVLCTNVAVSVFRILFSVMLLQRGPEDLPGSMSFLQKIVLLNALSGMMVLSSRLDAAMALANVALDIALILVFSYLVLSALNRRARFVQTAAAICGIGIFFHLLAWPLLLQQDLTDASDGTRSLMALMMLALISWELLVTANIFKRAIESSMTSAIALSFALFMISITVSQIIFSGAS